MSPPQLVIFGSLTKDNVVTAAGEILPQSFGGNAVYAALGARIWNDRVGIVSRVGREYPRAWLSQLAGIGINTDGIRERDTVHRMNVAFAYNEDGSRTRIIPRHLLDRMSEEDRARFYDSSTLADGKENLLEFGPDGDDMPEAWWREAAGIHCASMPMPRHLQIARAARGKAGNRPVWVGIDSPWHDNIGSASVDVAELLRTIDALLPSEQDFENYRPGIPRNVVAGDLIREGTRAIVLKRGGAGCRIFQGTHDPVDVPAFPVPAADPTGAGDAFCGGLLAGFLCTRDLIAAAHYGTVSASFAVERRGMQGLVAVDRAEARRRLAALSAKSGITVTPPAEIEANPC